MSNPCDSKNSQKNPILHHFQIGKNHWIHLAKLAMVLSPQIWASLEQSHYSCTFLPSEAPWGPYGPLGVKPSSLFKTQQQHQLELYGSF